MKKGHFHIQKKHLIGFLQTISIFTISLKRVLPLKHLKECMKKNKTYVQDSDISTILSSLGFKNITEEWPIRFIDSLPYSFTDIFDVHSRWIRKSQDNIFSEVLVGVNSFNRRVIDIIISSVCGKCKSQASEHIHCINPEWKGFLKKLISLNEQYVTGMALEAKEGMYKTE